jgi:hypothetical protein
MVYAGRRRRWLTTGALALAVILSVYDVPLRVMFWLSKPALDRYANHLYREVPMLMPNEKPQRVGLFWIKAGGAGPNHVGLDSWIWFTYVPDGLHAPWWVYLGSPWIPRWERVQLSEHWTAD